MLTFPAWEAGFGVPKLNENISAQIERAAHPLRAVAAKATISSRSGGVEFPIALISKSLLTRPRR